MNALITGEFSHILSTTFAIALINKVWIHKKKRKKNQTQWWNKQQNNLLINKNGFIFYLVMMILLLVFMFHEIVSVNSTWLLGGTTHNLQAQIDVWGWGWVCVCLYVKIVNCIYERDIKQHTAYRFKEVWQRKTCKRRINSSRKYHHLLQQGKVIIALIIHVN